MESGEASPEEPEKVVNCFAMRQMVRALLSEGQLFAQARLGNSVTHAVHFSAPGIHASDGGKCGGRYIYSLTSSLEPKRQGLLQPGLVKSAGGPRI